jgi:hypothetical protein
MASGVFNQVPYSIVTSMTLSVFPLTSFDLYSHCPHKREIKGVTNKSSKMLLTSEEKG